MLWIETQLLNRNVKTIRPVSCFFQTLSSVFESFVRNLFISEGRNRKSCCLNILYLFHNSMEHGNTNMILLHLCRSRNYTSAKIIQKPTKHSRNSWKSRPNICLWFMRNRPDTEHLHRPRHDSPCGSHFVVNTLVVTVYIAAANVFVI